VLGRIFKIFNKNNLIKIIKYIKINPQLLGVIFDP